MALTGEAGEYVKLQIKRYAPRELRETAEGKYWRQFRAPLIAQQVGGRVGGGGRGRRWGLRRPSMVPAACPCWDGPNHHGVSPKWPGVGGGSIRPMHRHPAGLAGCHRLAGLQIGAVTSIAFSPVHPFDFAVTSSTRVGVEVLAGGLGAGPTVRWTCRVLCTRQVACCLLLSGIPVLGTLLSCRAPVSHL